MKRCILNFSIVILILIIVGCAIPQVTLTINIEPTGAGTVTPASGGFYNVGYGVELEAAENFGYVFSEWKIGETTLSSDNPYTYTIPSSDVTITAVFKETNSAPNAPSAPNPANNETNVGTNLTQLTWSCSDPDGDTLTFDIYFGITLPTIPNATDLASTSWTINATLTSTTTYRWKVVANDGSLTTSGPEWLFETGSSAVELPPTKPQGPTPVNGAIGVNYVTVGLSCSTAGADSDGVGTPDVINHDLYFGTDAGNLPLYEENTDSLGSGPVFSVPTTGSLTPNTTYYWKVRAKEYNSGLWTDSDVWSFKTVSNDLTAPSNPNPANGATGVAIPLTSLDWADSTSSNGNIVYDLKIGLTPSLLSPLATVEDLPTSNWTVTGFTISSGTTYYWQVTAQDASGEEAGPVWSFTTAGTNSPPTVTLLTPANNSVDIPTNQQLTWDGNDTEGDPLKYHVYIKSVPNKVTILDSPAPTTTSFKISVEPAKADLQNTWFKLTKEGETNYVDTSNIYINSTDGGATYTVTLSGAAVLTDPSTLNKLRIDFSSTYLGVVGNTTGTIRIIPDTFNVPGSIPVASNVTDEFYSPALGNDTYYFWNIRATDNDWGRSVESSLWNFKTVALSTGVTDDFEPSAEFNWSFGTGTSVETLSFPAAHTPTHAIVLRATATGQTLWAKLNVTVTSPSTVDFWYIIPVSGDIGKLYINGIESTPSYSYTSFTWTASSQRTLPIGTYEIKWEMTSSASSSKWYIDDVSIGPNVTIN